MSKRDEEPLCPVGQSVRQAKKVVHHANRLWKGIGAMPSSLSARPFTFSGTVFELLLFDAKVWVLLGWMAMWFSLRMAGVVQARVIPDVAAKYLAYMQAILSFLLAFFFNSAYNEFKEQGRAAIAASDPATTAVVTAKLYLRHAPDVQERIVRLMNAAHYLSWMDLADFYSWSELSERGLLTQAEIDVLRRLPHNQKCVMVVVWACDMVVAYKRVEDARLQAYSALPNDQQTPEATPPSLNGEALKGLQSALNDSRVKYGALAILRGVQVPHMYVHLLFWMLFIFLLVLGVYAGIGVDKDFVDDVTDALWIIGYIPVMLGYLGVFNGAMAMREPFGVDAVDLNPLGGVEDAMQLHLDILALPIMSDEEQLQKPRWDMFHREKSTAATAGDAEACHDGPPPARGAPYLEDPKPTTNFELHELLAQLLPNDPLKNHLEPSTGTRQLFA